LSEKEKKRVQEEEEEKEEGSGLVRLRLRDEKELFLLKPFSDCLSVRFSVCLPAREPSGCRSVCRSFSLKNMLETPACRSHQAKRNKERETWMNRMECHAIRLINELRCIA
jgi:hypothetical protein